MPRAVLLLFWAAATLAAADFSGFWTGQMPTRNDDKIDISFQFDHKGNVLTGKLYQEIGSAAISEARVAGDLLTFVVVIREQAGNQINETRLRFTGKMVDGEIEVTRDREASNNAGNKGGVMFRGGTKVYFRLRKIA